MLSETTLVVVLMFLGEEGGGASQATNNRFHTCTACTDDDGGDRCDADGSCLLFQIGYKLDPTMFSTPQKQQLPLERCMRILPHQQVSRTRDPANQSGQSCAGQGLKSNITHTHHQSCCVAQASDTRMSYVYVQVAHFQVMGIMRIYFRSNDVLLWLAGYWWVLCGCSSEGFPHALAA